MSKRKLTAQDIFAIDLVGDVAVHPYKPKTAVVVKRMVPKTNKYESHIWMVSTNSSEFTQFTHSKNSEVSPQWSPDGRWLAFLSDRNTDQLQLFIMPEGGGEAVQVTRSDHGVAAFRWRPDGKAIALLAPVPEWAKDDPEPADCSDKAGPSEADEREEALKKRFTKDIRVIRRSYYRLDGTGFFDGKRQHLFVADVEHLTGRAGSRAASAGRDGTAQSAQPDVCVRVTEGPFEIDSFDWTADGGAFIVSSNVSPDDFERTVRQHLYRVEAPRLPLSNHTPPRRAEDFACLTSELHAAYSPKCSPDGRYIAFRGNNNDPVGAAQTRLYLYAFATGDVTCLTEDVDEWFESRLATDTSAGAADELTWAFRSDAIFSLVSTRGTVQLASIDVPSGRLKYLTQGEHTVFAYGVNHQSDMAVLSLGTTLDPANVHVLELEQDGQQSAPRRLTDWNRDFLAAVELAKPQRFTFESDGHTLDGWATLPAGTAPAGGWPTVVEVHGGPAMMYADSFFFEFQLLAAAGMAVISTNPRGSVGYGQDFCACIVADWGNLDFRDVEALADAALLSFPLDPGRMAIAGGSYGGFMSAWAIGHTERYKAAVVMRAVINWYSMVGTSDLGFATPFDEFRGALPWRDTDTYLRHSPITYVENVSASTLIIHSEEDYRCPIEQGEQFYQALRYLRVPVEFVRFPAESHGLSRSGKPWHRVARLEKIQSFLERELLGTEEGRV